MRKTDRLQKPLLFTFIALLAVNITFFVLWATRPNENSNTKASSIEFEETLVPVTGFYNFKSTNISKDELKNLEQITDPGKVDQDDTNIYLISLDDLDYRVRVINVDGQYPLDVLNGDSEFLTLNQTGVTALSRRMLTKVKSVGDGAYFAEKVADFLKSTDLTHTSNEVSFSDSCSIADMTLCSSPEMYSALTSIGVDIIELTGNHNNDWGASTNISTIEKYHDDGILTFGGGIDEEDAAKPLTFKQDGTDIVWLGVNNSTSTKSNGQGATGSHPGANIYDEETIKSQIKDAKEQGKFVIVDVQFFECYSYPDDGEEMPSCDYPISGQEEFFRNLIDMGADMVVGTQAHQPQTFELYQGKPIYYGLGNLFFDQVYWPGTMRSLILTHYFSGQKLLQTRITETMYDNNYQPAIVNEEDMKNYLTRLADASPKNQ